MKIDIRLKRSAPLRLRYTPGATGPSGTIAVNEVNTGAPGSPVIIQNIGTPENAVLNITIPSGLTGATGNKGWSPVLAVVPDGVRYVLQVADWTGGQGVKPAAGLYIGASGLTAIIADAINIRGPQGPSGSVTDGDKGDIVVSAAGTTWSIDVNVVDNTKLADMASGRLKGRATAGSGDPEDLTSAQATALLVVMTGDAGTGGAKGLVPAPAAGDAGKFLAGDGTFKDAAGGGSFKGERTIGASNRGDIFRVSEQQLDTNVTIASDENAYAPGPLTIATGVTLTVSAGGNLVIL